MQQHQSAEQISAIGTTSFENSSAGCAICSSQPHHLVHYSLLCSKQSACRSSCWNCVLKDIRCLGVTES